MTTPFESGTLQLGPICWPTSTLDPLDLFSVALAIQGVLFFWIWIWI